MAKRESLVTYTEQYQDLMARLDAGTLPVVSVRAMFARGVKHFLGNEVSSEVSQHEDKNPGISDQALDQYKAAAIAEAYQEILDGKVGISTRGPRGSSIETEMKKIATDRMRTLLANLGKSWPSKKDATVELPLPEGMVAFTASQLVERGLARPDEWHAKLFGTTLRAAAEKVLKDREKMAERAGKHTEGVLDI